MNTAASDELAIIWHVAPELLATHNLSTVAGLAKFLGISHGKVYREIRAKRLVASKGHFVAKPQKYFISEEQLLAWILRDSLKEIYAEPKSNI